VWTLLSVIDWDRQNGTQRDELGLPCKKASIIENGVARQSLIFIETIAGIDVSRMPAYYRCNLDETNATRHT
jgi:hypothetical protein